MKKREKKKVGASSRKGKADDFLMKLVFVVSIIGIVVLGYVFYNSYVRDKTQDGERLISTDFEISEITWNDNITTFDPVTKQYSFTNRLIIWGNMCSPVFSGAKTSEDYSISVEQETDLDCKYIINSVEKDTSYKWPFPLSSTLKVQGDHRIDYKIDNNITICCKARVSGNVAEKCDSFVLEKKC
jgi:hypothetical protein